MGRSVKRCHDCNKVMDGVPLPIGTYHCWDCVDAENNEATL